MHLTAARGYSKIETSFTFPAGGTPWSQPPKSSLARRSRRSRRMLDVTYTWGYQETRQKLRDLYDKAVRGQWISDDVLPWKHERRPRAADGPRAADAAVRLRHLQQDDREGAQAAQHRDVLVDALAVPARRAGRAARDRAARRLGRATSTASSTRRSQVVDEARHVDVYNRYVHTKIGFSYPVQPAPEDAARHDPQGQPLGHEVPRHADHGRGPRARRVRHDPQQHAGAAAQASSPRT